MSERLIDKYNAIQKIGTDVDCPWEVKHSLGIKRLSVFGDQLCIGDNDVDYVDLSEARKAVQWLVDQLGGKVKWNDDK